MSKKPCIAIVGRQKDTLRYEMTLKRLSLSYKTTLSVSDCQSCAGLLLPGGGDITPAFFGQQKAGSRNIDTELDIIQLQALEQAVRYEKPVLGICKGLQIINVFFGGTIIQHMKQADRHCYRDGDQYHDTTILPDSFLYRIYGERLLVNSAHHQCVGRLGNDLCAVQFAADENTPVSITEGLCHKSLPVYGVQWHPERLQPHGDALFLFWQHFLV
ncbi:MAG: gamma-glutamyl-gamma-aminobutyrate hydrolase family protein [Lachnospiraceae bacterium]